jgi:hypothetical protein
MKHPTTPARHHVIPLVLAAVTIVVTLTVNPIPSDTPTANGTIYVGDPLTTNTALPDTSKRICASTQPPDYPGCTAAQVRALAESNIDDWVEDERFGKSKDILDAAGLTSNQQDLLKTALRQDIRAALNEQADAAAKRGVDKSTWTAEWRGTSYAIADFPYVRYVNLTFAQDDGSCWMPASDADWQEWYAYNYCSSKTVPNNKEYWGVNVDANGKDLYDWLNKDGGQLHFACDREILLGTAGGVSGGALGGLAIFGGPGAVLGALGGGVTAGTATAVVCLGNKILNQLGWDD